MEPELRILVLEDVAVDVVLLNRELRRSGLTFRSKRVDTKKAFLSELEENPPDIILSDHGLPGFDGLSALAIAHDKCPDTPFVFLSGTFGGEMAGKLPEGATAYVHKDHLGSRLVPVIRRVLAEAKDRQRHKLVEQALQDNAEQFRLLVDCVTDSAVCILDEAGVITHWNTSAECIWGYAAEEIVGRNFSCFYSPEDIASGKPQQSLRVALVKGGCEEQGWRVRKGGDRFPAKVVINVLRGEGGGLGGFGHVTRNDR